MPDVRIEFRDWTNRLLVAAAMAALVPTMGVAADLPAQVEAPVVMEEVPVATGYTDICGRPLAVVPIFFDHRGKPTPVARTPYYYCVTGRTLTPYELPPTYEYCCG